MSQVPDNVLEEIEATIEDDGVEYVSLNYSEEIPKSVAKLYFYDDETDMFGYRNEVYTDGKMEPIEAPEDPYMKIELYRLSNASFVVRLSIIYRQYGCGYTENHSTLAIDVYGSKEIYEKIKDYLEKLSKKLNFELDA